jgi:hypothetical protein
MSKENPIPANSVSPGGNICHTASSKLVLHAGKTVDIPQTKISNLFLQSANVSGLRKNLLFFKTATHFVIFLAGCLYSVASSGQNAVHPNIYENLMMTHQADSVKQDLSAKGFVVVKEAFMEMTSEYEMPIVVPLNQGTWYQFVFIGDITSKLYEVRMYDWEERQVVYQKKQWGDVDGNVISYSYIPQFSEYHMIKPVQVNKTKKQLYGYAMLFKKVVS